jgi:alkaline phosphatase D
VASGAPRTESVVLWTRLAPLPLEGGGMDPEPCEVRWEIADGRQVSQDRSQRDPHRPIPSARTRCTSRSTASSPGANTITGSLRREAGEPRWAARARHPRTARATSGCVSRSPRASNTNRAISARIATLAAEGVDLVAFLGDYIYESSWGREHVRKHSAGEPRTLAEYRNRYAQYKSDADLQVAHAAAPWLVIWDDHEVDNDYADDRSEDLDPAFLARRAAAYRAFLEHMPIRRSALLEGGGIRIYDRHEWGELATIHALDDRQYRSHQPCPKPGRGGSAIVDASCTARHDPALTMLGAEQERWLDDGLARSRSRWNLIAQQTLFTAAGYDNKKDVRVHWTDGWDGYPAARERLLASIAERRAANPVIIGGDVHASFVADLRLKPGDDASPVIATEFCGTSITSQGWPDTADAIRRANPDIRFADARQRGYVVLDLSRRGLEARMRCVDSVKKADMSISTLASFTVAEGTPGAQK